MYDPIDIALMRKIGGSGGGASSGGVQDVRLNGERVVEGGIANIPYKTVNYTVTYDDGSTGIIKNVEVV